MKKIIAMLLVVTMIAVLLAGCGGSGKKTLKILDTDYVLEDYAICVAKENTELLDSINAALAELEADGTRDAIVGKYINNTPHTLTFQADVAADAPVLTMATNAAFPPYEYYEGGNIVGIDAEMAAAIADKLGMKLVVEDTEFGSIIGGVQTGKYDIGMAGMTVTDERLESVNFSSTYATGIQSVIVIDGGEIKTLDDLFADGAKYLVGVQQDTTGDIYSAEDFGEDRVVRFPKGADAVQALLTGKIDCVIIDNEPAKNFVANNNG